jgi:hypothetical protein
MGLLNLVRRIGTLVSPTRDTSQIVYSLPDAVFRKYFNQDEFFDEVDWGDWKAVVGGFEKRFDKWYFVHLQGNHASYVDLCALCALIDVFSLYQSGTSWHAPKTYKEFLRKLHPAFRKQLQAPIRLSRYEQGAWKDALLKDVADVFYAGVRCSLHHHGDLSSFAGMSGTGQVAREHPNAGFSVDRRQSYSLIVFDPGVLKIHLRRWLATYCRDLRLDPGSPQARAFRTRILTDFGISVP